MVLHNETFSSAVGTVRSNRPRWTEYVGGLGVVDGFASTIPLDLFMIEQIKLFSDRNNELVKANFR